MSRSTRFLRTAVTAAALLAGAALGAAPAQAAPGFEPSDGSVTPSLPRSTLVGKTGCRVYGSSNGFGAYCNAVEGTGRTVEQILAAAGIPPCWNEEPSEVLADDYEAMRQQRLLGGEQGRYWVRVCLRFEDDNPLFDTEAEWIAPPQLPVLLTQAQQNLIAVYNRRELPAPTVHVSPVSQPRVFQPVAFSLDPIEPNPMDPAPYEVTVQRGGVRVTVQAQLHSVAFEPADGVTLPCPGGGVVVAATDTPASRPDACWWAFPHSSAAQVDQVYPVHATAYWTIRYQVGGVWTEIGVYPKELGDLRVRVSEVQTVVVP